jgi:ATP-dependent Clp protease protease subunit
MTYLTPREALEYGLIDRILTSQKPLPVPLAGSV